MIEWERGQSGGKLELTEDEKHVMVYATYSEDVHLVPVDVFKSFASDLPGSSNTKLMS